MLEQKFHFYFLISFFYTGYLFDFLLILTRLVFFTIGVILVTKAI